MYVHIPTLKNKDDGRYYYNKLADTLTLSQKMSYCNKTEDFEKPEDEWNTMEIYTVNGKSVHLVNG